MELLSFHTCLDIHDLTTRGTGRSSLYIVCSSKYEMDQTRVRWYTRGKNHEGCFRACLPWKRGFLTQQNPWHSPCHVSWFARQDMQIMWAFSYPVPNSLGICTSFVKSKVLELYEWNTLCCSVLSWGRWLLYQTLIGLWKNDGIHYKRICSRLYCY